MKSVKFQGDMLNIYDFIQVFIFITNHHLKDKYSCILGEIILLCNNPVTLLIRAPDKRWGGRVVRWYWVNFQCRGILLI